MRKYALALVILALFVVVPMALAQEPTPTPNFPPVDLEGDVTTLLNVLLTSILGAAIASPFVTTLVGVLKLIPQLKDVKGELLATVTAVVVYLAAAAATRFNFGAQFYSLIDVLQYILPVLLTLVGASVTYNVARKVDAPVMGYQRPNRQ